MIRSRQLEYFRAVARELHFTRAAEVLRIAQPALSQQIRKLERSLGLALFERDHHKVRITPAGTALLEHAERILSDLTAVEEEMLGWAEGVRGRIRLGTVRGFATRLVRLTAAFAGEFPLVDLELREEASTEIVADLHAGKLDAATLAARPPVDSGRLELHSLGQEPLVLVTGPETPLAARGRVRLADLDGADLVLYQEGSPVREAILSALGQAGATPRVRFETREYNTARILASAGLAAAILPRSVAEEPGQPIRLVPLDPELTWTPCLAWPAQRRTSPAVSALIDFVVRHPELASAGNKTNA